MSKENQKKLYENFKKLSEEGKTEKQRVECGKYADEILQSYPEFEKIEKETKPVEKKEVKEKK